MEVGTYEGDGRRRRIGTTEMGQVTIHVHSKLCRKGPGLVRMKVQ